MKKLIVLVLAFVFLGSTTVSAQEASSLQNQSNSTVQGNGSSSVQNTGSQTPQGIDSLDKLSSGGTSVPLSPATSGTQTSVTTEENENSIVRKVLVGFAILGIFIAGLIVWGAADRRRIQEEIAVEKVVVSNPKTKKKKQSSSRRKKKAHR